MDAGKDALEARIVALEELAAHQALTIEELSAELAGQWRSVERLEKSLRALVDRFTELEEQGVQAPAITRPPHY